MLTHACPETIEPEIEIQSDRGASIRLTVGNAVEIRRDGSANGADLIPVEGGRYGNIISVFTQRLRGVADAPSGGTLEMARAHVVAINGASEAAAVHTISPQYLYNAPAKDGSPVSAIRDITAIFRHCIQHRKLLSESGLAPWSKKSASMSLVDYKRFNGTKRASPA